MVSSDDTTTDADPHVSVNLDPHDNLSISGMSLASSHSSFDDDLEPQVAFKLTLHLHGRPAELSFYRNDATLQDLSDTVAEELRIPLSNQKFLVTPKTGILKPPFRDPDLKIKDLLEKKIVLMGATVEEIQELKSDITQRKERMRKRGLAQNAGRKIKAIPYRDPKRLAEESQYTFRQITALPYLPNPDKSLRFLQRLANDAGIKAAMRKHRFSVGMLTELNPAEATTHESRLLGLNKNQGEQILLRLRTDAYDGYRDYKVIRKTLCHELAHNVHGPHERPFWDLCHAIEREVEANDWRRGGKSVGGEEFYNPRDNGLEEGEEGVDAGGFVGGEFVLGGSEGSGEALAVEGVRVVAARAAEERARKAREEKERAKGGRD